MQTQAFEEGLAELRALTAKGVVALMCAEALPWRCHRSLVADALTVRGARVEHISGPGHSSSHHITPFARVEGERVTYPGEGDRNRLSTRGPFHLEATVRVLQRRPTNLVDIWEEGRYQRVLSSGDRLVLVEVENRGTIDHPDVRLSVRHGDEAAAWRAGLGKVVRTILGLDVDLEPIQHIADTEQQLRSTASALRGMRPPRFPALFEAFANVVPFQQVSLDAGVAIARRLVERFGESIETSGRRFHAFPTAQAVAGARLTALRRCGLSSHKAESLRAIAQAIASGELNEATIAAMSTTDALRSLTKLPGVGPWSAALVLLRGLGRLDVFPPGDVGAVRGLRDLLHLRADVAVGHVVEHFGDLRGYLYFYSLGNSLLARGLIHAAPPVLPDHSTSSGATDRPRRARRRRRGVVARPLGPAGSHSRPRQCRASLAKARTRRR
jgi:DNA-3-methyladenine glycosylase II